MVINKKITIDLEALEDTYLLNFHSHKRNVLDFAQSSWNLSALFLSFLKKIKKITPKQKVCIYMLGKSMRLLRTISKLVTRGYWPEGEILYRGLFETQVLLSYILRDDTDKRAGVWLNRTRPKERWPMSEMLKELDKSFDITYTNLSLYPHSHIISVINYVDIHSDGAFSISQGPLGGDDNNIKAAWVLGSAAMINASMCELAAPHFNLPPAWQESHLELMALPYFQQQIPMVKDFLSKEKNIQLVNQFLNKGKSRIKN